MLVGGAPVDEGMLARIAARCDKVIAADGGADRLAATKIRPDAIIGDIDSLRHPQGWDAPVHRLAEQETTDFDKCLRSVKAPLHLCVGFTGGLMDHALAAFASIARSNRAAILIGDGDLCFRAWSGMHLELPADLRVSLFPMGRTRGRSKGLRWPLDGLELDPAGRIATSNRATGPIEIAFDGGPLLAILPLEALDHVSGVLEAQRS
ncbi:thiamine diphosphokinase [Roseobacter sp. HKCCA0434]|uniref:thiamine diphosphokinase n=1 Tax=Roseobacter sp. HKCCA0434 TaxID=3079297 RepID=UPI002905C144|nr:thiamine diphosphokinase [Roseobacter sp. HKCCA0434]